MSISIAYPALSFTFENTGAFFWIKIFKSFAWFVNVIFVMSQNRCPRVKSGPFVTLNLGS